MYQSVNRRTVWGCFTCPVVGRRVSNSHGNASASIPREIWPRSGPTSKNFPNTLSSRAIDYRRAWISVRVRAWTWAEVRFRSLCTYESTRDTLPHGKWRNFAVSLANPREASLFLRGNNERLASGIVARCDTPLVDAPTLHVKLLCRYRAGICRRKANGIHEEKQRRRERERLDSVRAWNRS